MRSFLQTLVLSSICAVRTAAQTVTFTAPSTNPTSASPPVDQSFLGLMVETTSWWQYGNVDVSVDFIQNIVNRTGAPVIIRVGGTSGGQTMYNASQEKGNIWPYMNLPKDGLFSPVTLGKPFTKALANVPNVRYIIQVPLANTTINDTVAFTRAILQSIPADKVEAIEVGNEPNLYDGQFFRGKPRRAKPYTPEEYITELKNYTNAIIDGVAELPNGNIFHVGSLADSSQWSAEDLYNAGLADVNRIKTFAQHYYQSRIKDLPTMNGTYLSHASSILHKIDLNPQETLDYFRSAGIDTPVIISEAGSSLGGVNRTEGSYEREIDAVLGSALWEIDWVLLAMSKGISRVNMNQCNGCNFAGFWAADGENGPQVFAQYYGLMFLSDWLGLGNATQSGSFQVASLYDDARPYISPYAGFVDGRLDRLAVLDMNQWNMTESTPRVERTFSISVGSDVKSAELRRLTGNGTDATVTDGGITYAGTQWIVESPAGVSVGNETEAVSVQSGKVSFKMKASEALLITLHR